MIFKAGRQEGRRAGRKGRRQEGRKAGGKGIRKKIKAWL